MTFLRIVERNIGLTRDGKNSNPRSVARIYEKETGETEASVVAAIDEVNHGSVEPLDRIIRKKI